MKIIIPIILLNLPFLITTSAETIYYNGVGGMRTLHYDAGAEYWEWRDSGPTPEIEIRVDGIVDSVSFQPIFSLIADGQPSPDKLPFEMYQSGIYYSTYFLVDPNDTRVTLTRPSDFYSSDFLINVSSDFGEWPHFANYQVAHSSEDLTFTFGFRLESLTYIPAVPEPGTMALLGSGLLTL